MNIDIQGRSFRGFKAGDSNPGSLRSLPGGVGRNIAENLVRLGLAVELVSVMGRDEGGARLEASCRALGIGLEGTLRLEDGPSCHYLCLLDSEGRLAGAVAAMDSMDRLVPERLEERAGLFDSADLILVDANIPEESIRWIAARYPRGRRRPLLGLDPVSVTKAGKAVDCLGSFDFAKPNRAEAALLAGLSAEVGASEEVDSRGALELAAALRARGLGEAFVSLGAGGLVAEGPGKTGLPERWSASLPPRAGALSLVNVSGAGDAACAAIAWGFLERRCLGERCALALAAALIASASESPVNPSMSAALLLQTAKGIPRERVS
jgi:pseudouridine kinase